MPETSRLELPYPANNDLATVPAHIEDLAEEVETNLVRAGAIARYCHISGAQDRTGGGYALLGTPDRIQNISLAGPGILNVAFSAICIHLGTDVQAAIFVGEDGRLESPNLGGTTIEGHRVRTLGSSISSAAEDSGSELWPLTWVSLPVDAGTHDVSVRWRSPGGATISDRYLWVWAQEFEDVSPS